eukprot:4319141-Alexandrium_andersonii.AAC.1
MLRLCKVDTPRGPELRWPNAMLLGELKHGGQGNSSSAWHHGKLGWLPPVTPPRSASAPPEGVPQL